MHPMRFESSNRKRGCNITMKKGDVITDQAGTRYTLVESLGRGGQAKVWKVQCKQTRKFYAYKFYKKNLYNVRGNIEDLVKLGAITDKNGQQLDCVVLPITIVEGVGESFGYIMDLVDLKNYTTLKKAWCGKYPTREALCKIVQNMAHFFVALHGTTGLCYKDVNEGNIYFNPATGDIKIIDNDNIGHASRFTIKGTVGYMAPEVVLGDNPDERSDSFAFAVYVFRLLTGGYPFEGRYTKEYCINNQVCETDARKVIFGTDAIYIWHPTDRRNSVEGTNNPKWTAQAKEFKKLPESIKALFEKTFVTNLPKDRRGERTRDEEWSSTFATLEQTLVKCPRCRCVNFAGSSNCCDCDVKLPKTSTPPKITAQTTTSHTTLPLPPKHKVVFKCLSAGEPKHEKTLYVRDVVDAESISKNLPAGSFLKVLYNKSQKKIGVKNLSTMTWTVIYPDKSKKTCAPGEVQELDAGMMLRFIPKVAQMNVVEVD